MSGAERDGIERRHLAESFRPVFGEALDFLRIAGVWDAPDEEIAGAEDAEFGTEDPTMVVGFARTVADLEGESADGDVQSFVIEEVWGDIGRLGEGFVIFGAFLGAVCGAAKLSGVEGGVVLRGQGVALESRRHIFMGDDARRGLVFCQEVFESEGVIHVALGEDGGMDGVLGFGSEHLGDLGREAV